MKPEQQKAAARVAVHQFNNAKQMLSQGWAAIDAGIGRDKIPREAADAFWDAGVAIMTLLNYAQDACIDNAEQSGKVTK